MATVSSEEHFWLLGVEWGGIAQVILHLQPVEAVYFLEVCLTRTSSAATSAALATKLLMLLRSSFAASSTCLRSSSVK